MEDEALAIAYQAGDIHAFDELYRRYAGRVHGYVSGKLAGSVGNAGVDEVVQSVFLKLHERRHDYDPKYLFVQWLFVIARSVTIDRLRKKDRLEVHWEPEELARVPAAAASESELAALSQSAGLTAYLDRFPAETRRVIELRLVDEASYREIARKVGGTEASVRQIFSRAIKALRQAGRRPRHAE